MYIILQVSFPTNPLLLQVNKKIIEKNALNSNRQEKKNENPKPVFSYHSILSQISLITRNSFFLTFRGGFEVAIRNVVMFMS